MHECPISMCIVYPVIPIVAQTRVGLQPYFVQLLIAWMLGVLLITALIIQRFFPDRLT